MSVDSCNLCLIFNAKALVCKWFEAFKAFYVSMNKKDKNKSLKNKGGIKWNRS